MKFVLPGLEYEQQAKDYIREFQECGSSINGCAGLDEYLKEGSYAEWVERVMDDLDMAGATMGKVPSFTYFYVNDGGDRMVGMVNIRLSLQGFWQMEGGHVGFSIRPAERGKHHATNLLREALGLCKLLGLDEAVLSCARSNAACARGIQNCGGILEAEFYSNTFGEEIQRYVIVI